MYHGVQAVESSHVTAGEKADQLKRSAKAAKTDKKVKKAKAEGKVTKKKFKGIRIRKGVRVKVRQATHRIIVYVVCNKCACYLVVAS